MSAPVAEEQDSPLAAMISTLAQVNAAQQEGLSWNEIAARCGYPSGRQAKKTVHSLKAQVRRELAAAAARQVAMMPARGPYVHEFTGPVPEDWTYDEYKPYTMTGPGVAAAER
jgi:hypothetical protein